MEFVCICPLLQRNAVHTNLFRGGKGKPGAAKKGKKNARKESYDLIVNIDMQEWNLTREQVLHHLDTTSSHLYRYHGLLCLVIDSSIHVIKCHMSNVRYSKEFIGGPSFLFISIMYYLQCIGKIWIGTLDDYIYNIFKYR